MSCLSMLKMLSQHIRHKVSVMLVCIILLTLISVSVELTNYFSTLMVVSHGVCYKHLLTLYLLYPSECRSR